MVKKHALVTPVSVKHTCLVCPSSLTVTTHKYGGLKDLTSVMVV